MANGSSGDSGRGIKAATGCREKNCSCSTCASRMNIRSAIIGGYLIPLNDLPKRVNELDSSREIVVHCKMGGRSAKAVAFLQQAGFTKVHNLAGGIMAWSDRVDPKMPKY